MNDFRLHTYCFSPTGTSRKNMMAMVQGVGEERAEHHDCTKEIPAYPMLGSNDVALFSVPVYGGYVAPLALKRLEGVKGENTPAILLVTYGNRDFEKALEQLAEFVSHRGFYPIAAAAMIGEHSYGNQQYPIAMGRPDQSDLTKAVEFGMQVREKLNSQVFNVAESNPKAHSMVDVKRDMPKVKTPLLSKLRFIKFVLGYQRRQKRHPVKVYPQKAVEKCIHCGACAKSCPTGAIAIGQEEVTDTAHCIRCCACVKGCPTAARTFNSPFAPALSANFKKRREPLFLW
ncbi:MAG: 4Fe-4S binding protein [Bacteroidaceae bacterium]|nr:4Fe-4S binding protein [Bacteroidaceae bacterium]